MQMAEELDAGDIILQEETPIGGDETFDLLHDRLAKRGAEMLIQAIEMILNGTVHRVPQDGSAVTYAPSLRKEDGLLRWGEDVSSIVNLIRGFIVGARGLYLSRGEETQNPQSQGRDNGYRRGARTIVSQEGKGLKVASWQWLGSSPRFAAGKQKKDAR